MTGAPPLAVCDLSVHGPAPARPLVQGIDLDLAAGTLTALVGASGAGKTLTLRAIAQLLPEPLTCTGQVLLSGSDLLSLPRRRLRALRGPQLAWVAQDATASLNPTVTVGRHLREALRAHQHLGRSDVRVRSLQALGAVGLPDPETVLAAYPFELSGGQAQRVALALATACDPQVVLADEVTAELDVVSQAEVFALLRQQADLGRAVLLVTHDLPAVARFADRQLVMAAGRLSSAPPPLTRLSVQAPAHPRVHLEAPGQLDAAPPETRPTPLLQARGVSQVLTGHSRSTLALDQVDLTVRPGESVALLGRSGSGKSTLAGILALLDRPQTGTVHVNGVDLWAGDPAALRAARRTVGVVFQDTLASFDPRYDVEQVVAQALQQPDRAAVRELLTRVGLAPELADRAPRTLSGGQQQRVALARALAGDPQVLLADEPTSGLDLDAQDHLARLLAGLRDRDGLTLVLVTHDLRVAAEIADRLVVLEQGRVVEDLPAVALSEARHPATLGLLDAVDTGTAPAAPIISARREPGDTPTTTRGAAWTP